MRLYSLKNNSKTVLAVLLALILTICGCGANKSNDDMGNISEQNTIENNGSNEMHSDSSSNDMFSDRDLKTDYDAKSAVSIKLADGKSTCDSSAVDISENVITIKNEGTYILSGTLKDGQIVVDAEKSDKLWLVFDNVSINNDTSASIYIKKADKVFVTLAEDSKNELSNKGDFEALENDDNNVDGVVFSKCDLTFNGSGTLTVVSENGHGIVSKDDLKVAGGSYDIKTQKQALAGNDSVRIIGSDFAIETQKDGIHTKNDKDEGKGFVYIEDSRFSINASSDGVSAVGYVLIDNADMSINAGNDGIHADSTLTINSGNIAIGESKEGLEGKSILINGGNISVNARDDGLNASGDSSENGFGDMPGGAFGADGNCSISITGGRVYVNAQGDGIDSNGMLYVSGGEVFVDGPENGGNGALDYGVEGVITGGTVVAVGNSGMAVNFGENSTQCSMLVNLQTMQSKGQLVLKDSAGKDVVSFSPAKTYNSVVISSPEIKQGETYTLIAGSETVTVEMSSMIYGLGSGFEGGFNGGFGGRPEGEFGEKPEGGFGGRPEGEFGEKPEGGFGGRPEGEFGEKPEGGFGGRPDEGVVY